MLPGVMLVCELCLVSLVSQFGHIKLFEPYHLIFHLAERSWQTFWGFVFFCSADPTAVRGTQRSHEQHQDQALRVPCPQPPLSHPLLNNHVNGMLIPDDVTDPIFTYLSRLTAHCLSQNACT